MISKISRSTLAKKFAVFAVSFFVIVVLSIITVLPPQRGANATIHVPPVDTLEDSLDPAHYGYGYDFFCHYTAAEEENTTILGAPGREEKWEEEAEVLPVFSAMPAAAPLYPHVDTLGFFYLEQIPLSYELQRYTYYRSAALGIEYELVLALMWRESTFRIEAVSINRNGTQDSGLMQINDVNRGWLEERYGIYNLMDPFQNIDAGTLILADLLSRYGEKQALMAYQFGESGMLRLIREGADAGARTIRVREKRDEFRIMRAQAYNDLQP